MPIPYTVIQYGCQFKCGAQHESNIYAMERHEKKCWKNPKNRTCVTCKYAEVEHEESVFFGEGSGGRYRMCNAPNTIFTDEMDYKPIQNCGLWEPLEVVKCAKKEKEGKENGMG